MTDTATRPTPELGRLRPIIRVLLAVAAGAVLTGWSIGADPTGWRWGAFAVLIAAAIVSRLAQAKQRGEGPQLALVFVGALVLLVDPAQAVWGAAIVGLSAILRRDSWSRITVSAATLTLAQSAAVLAKELSDPLQEVTVGQGTTGPFGVEPFSVTSALTVVIVLALGWAALRWVAAWLGRRSRTAAWRAQLEARWLRDLTLAASAVVTAVLWAVHPPLVLLVLVTSLAVMRGNGRSDEVQLANTAFPGVATPAVLRVALTEELMRASQFDRPVSTLVIDIDGLRRVNSRHGIDAGDEVVRRVTGLVTEIARDYDIVARLSDDAFAVVMPECPRAGAVGLAERVRDGVRELAIGDEAEPISVTVSIGVASFPGDAEDREGLLTEAELAADYASLGGGDRLATAAELPQGFRTAGATADGTTPSVDRRGADAAPVTEPLAPDRLVRATPEALSQPRPATDRLLIATVVAAVIASGIATALFPVPPNLSLTLLFLLLAVGAEWFSESIYGRADSSWAAVPLVALAVSADVGPVSMLLAGLGTGLIGGALRGNSSRQRAFNAAVLVMAGLAAWAVGAPVADIRGDDLLPAALTGVVAGAAFFAIDTWLVAGAVALAHKASVFDVWREDLAWLVPHQLGMGLLGGAMAFAQSSLGTPGTVLLVVPAVALHVAQRQFTRRTRENVVRLRNLNDDMEDANRRVARVNERLTDALDQVNQGYLTTVESLAASVQAKDGYAGSRIDRVEHLGRRLLEVLEPGLAEDEAVIWGFRLHDIGKVGVPDRVLLKRGPLDEEEWRVVRSYPVVGADIIAAAPFLQGARDVILHHHERWDGTGYPYGLSQQAIPFTARVFAVVGAFDAMVSDRPYRPALSLDDAVAELVRGRGTQFDPEVVEAFQEIPLAEITRIRAQADAAGEQRTHPSMLAMRRRYADLAVERERARQPGGRA